MTPLLKLSVLEAGHSWSLIAPDGAAYTLTLVAGKLQVCQTNISAIAAAASLAVGVGSTTGVAVSDAGAAAINSIQADTNAYVQSSQLDAHGDVDVGAANSSLIDATIVAVSVAVGAGGTTGVGASIGFSMARNVIGWSTSGADSLLFVAHKSTDTPDTLTKGARVRIASGPGEGDVYEYLGETLTDEDPHTSGAQKITLANQNYQDDGLWKQLGLESAPGQVLAYTQNSQLTVSGALTLDAEASQSIDALVP